MKYLGFGSPLMDIIGDVNSSLIKKHNLKLDETIHRKITETNIFSVLENECEVTYVPGGCSYNTMRVLNFMLGDKGSVGVLGSVGNDNYGDLYEKLLKEESIHSIFEKYTDVNTGVCAVYCHNKDRGHVTDLGASTLVSQDFVQETWDSFKQVDLIYTELFILKHRKNIVYLLAELGTCERKVFGFNLPSFYFIETFLEDIKSLFEHADVVFTNAAEAVFFGNLLGIQDSENLGELCVHLAKLPKKNKKRSVLSLSPVDPILHTSPNTITLITISHTPVSIYPNMSMRNLSLTLTVPVMPLREVSYPDI